MECPVCNTGFCSGIPLGFPRWVGPDGRVWRRWIRNHPLPPTIVRCSWGSGELGSGGVGGPLARNESLEWLRRYSEDQGCVAMATGNVLDWYYVAELRYRVWYHDGLVCNVPRAADPLAPIRAYSWSVDEQPF